MVTAGLSTFDSAVQQANEWVKEVGQELHTDDRQTAYLALRATLHALRDNLVIDESADFAAQLPMLIRGLYYEGWKPSKTPLKDRHRDTFLERVGGALDLARPAGIYPEPAVQAVFKVLSNHVSAGEVDDVRQALPQEIRQIWA
jgi:uncharacterized protein (DUF2267 family)